MKELKQKIQTGVEALQLYWDKPPKGRYMPFKEIASLAAGGMGVKFICYAVQLMLLSVGNTLIGNTIGIAPREMYVIYVISVIASFPLTGIRARMVDNSKNKRGRFRPYIFTMAIPTVILAIGFTWMPYEQMSMLWKCVTVLLYNIGFQFFYMMMFDSYTNIINVLSPNTYERSDAYSITGIVDSFAPTIISFVLPLLAQWVTGQNTIYDMRVYRAVFPPILLVGLLLTILIYNNTEEKIVQAKTHVIQIKFMDSLRAIGKNKYFWLISCAGWIGFLESSFATILAWLYNYQNACSALEYSIITAIYGNSALWSMLFAPLLVRKIGKRKLMIYSNLMSIFFIMCMYPVVTDAPKEMMIWLLMGCMFINGVGTSLGNTLTYSLNSDIRDYQQYITGERIDGMFFAAGLISSVVTMITGVVLPMIYDYAGLNEATARSLGYDGSNVYYVLYDTGYFERICGILIIASTIGATLNVIPYFFYDLTELKQKAMVTVLKIRALFEDYGNGVLSDEKLVEAIDLIDEAREYVNKEPVKPSKAEIKAARKTHDKEKIRAARAAYQAQHDYNEKIAIAKYVVEEVDKFDSPEMQEELRYANHVYAAGLDGLKNLHTISVADARRMPKKTKAGKQLRKKMIERAKGEAEAKKMLAKHYPNGIEMFDMQVFTKLFEADDSLETKRNELIEARTAAQKAKDKDRQKEIARELRQLTKEKQSNQKKMKEASNAYSKFNRAARPYLNAKKLLTQQENYSHYDEIKASYEEAKARFAAQTAADALAQEQAKKEREAYAAKLRAEKKAARKKNRAAKK